MQEFLVVYLQLFYKFEILLKISSVGGMEISNGIVFVRPERNKLGGSRDVGDCLCCLVSKSCLTLL